MRTQFDKIGATMLPSNVPDEIVCALVRGVPIWPAAFPERSIRHVNDRQGCWPGHGRVMLPYMKQTVPAADSSIWIHTYLFA